MSEYILIIDFGSQFTQLIARRIREENIYCEIIPFNKITRQTLEKHLPRGIILSGGPASVTEDTSPRLPDFLFQMGLPILGICYGQQMMVEQLGGDITPGDRREFGRAYVDITKDCALCCDAWPKGAHEQVWMSHGDQVTRLPQGFTAVGASKESPFAIIADEQRQFYGVQFHPEVVHTPNGSKLLRNFARGVAGCTGSWTMIAFMDQEIEKIRSQVGDKRVICGLSGGVDSSVTAVLLHKAIKEQLNCIFIDTGMMRLNEAAEVVTLFNDHYNIPLIHVDATDTFLQRLQNVSDPEQKRKIIGKTFIDIFEREANKLGTIDFLAQGTLYPDVIESVSPIDGPSVTIKSHHNVGGLPERMSMGLVEPLRELFKDEVRLLGRELGLPEAILGRHPFPGPGLAIRIPGPVDRTRLDILRKADAIYLEEIRNAGLYDDIWQAFAVLLPVQTVGVMGDGRTYDFVCALRAVTSVDGMTADYYHFDAKLLGHMANRIINEVTGINRVVYDVTSKPPGTIEWE